ncbi:hypothetical protein BC832DRAFT_537689 [Gaertneriomyces semiglobifer]|nr:hypothetical protein BC832DRAFT_537689 [Gaertneriomyces semiglobifer]
MADLSASTDTLVEPASDSNPLHELPIQKDKDGDKAMDHTRIPPLLTTENVDLSNSVVLVVDQQDSLDITHEHVDSMLIPLSARESYSSENTLYDGEEQDDTDKPFLENRRLTRMQSNFSLRSGSAVSVACYSIFDAYGEESDGEQEDQVDTFANDDGDHHGDDRLDLKETADCAAASIELVDQSSGTKDASAAVVLLVPNQQVALEQPLECPADTTTSVSNSGMSSEVQAAQADEGTDTRRTREARELELLSETLSQLLQMKKRFSEASNITTNTALSATMSRGSPVLSRQSTLLSRHSRDSIRLPASSRPLSIAASDHDGVFFVEDRLSSALSSLAAANRSPRGSITIMTPLRRSGSDSSRASSSRGSTNRGLLRMSVLLEDPSKPNRTESIVIAKCPKPSPAPCGPLPPPPPPTPAEEDDATRTTSVLLSPVSPNMPRLLPLPPSVDMLHSPTGLVSPQLTEAAGSASFCPPPVLPAPLSPLPPTPGLPPPAGLLPPLPSVVTAMAQVPRASLSPVSPDLASLPSPPRSSTKALRTLGIISPDETQASNGAQWNEKALKLLGVADVQPATLARARTEKSGLFSRSKKRLTVFLHQPPLERRASTASTTSSHSQSSHTAQSSQSSFLKSQFAPPPPSPTLKSDSPLPTLESLLRNPKPPLKTGYLLKYYPSRLTKKWRKRLVVLVPGFLYLFKEGAERSVACLFVGVGTECGSSVEDGKPTSDDSVSCPHSSTGPVFWVRSGSQAWYFSSITKATSSAESDDLSEWLTTLDTQNRDDAHTVLKRMSCMSLGKNLSDGIWETLKRRGVEVVPPSPPPVNVLLQMTASGPASPSSPATDPVPTVDDAVPLSSADLNESSASTGSSSVVAPACEPATRITSPGDGADAASPLNVIVNAELAMTPPMPSALSRADSAVYFTAPKSSEERLGTVEEEETVEEISNPTSESVGRWYVLYSFEDMNKQHHKRISLKNGGLTKAA